MKKKVVITALVIVVIAGCLLLTIQLGNFDFHNFIRSMHGG
jgi:hypothetical protein